MLPYLQKLHDVLAAAEAVLAAREAEMLTTDEWDALEHAVAAATELFHARGYLTRTEYQELLARGSIEPEVLDLMEEGVSTDWSKDVFPQLLEEGRPMYGYVADGYWTDVGDIGEYMRASGDVLHHREVMADKKIR